MRLRAGFIFPSRCGGKLLRIPEWNSLVDLADFAPYVPCGMRNQCLSIIRHAASSLGWCIRIAHNGFISSWLNLALAETPIILSHGRRIWKARQTADFRHWEFHVFFDQKVNSPKRVFFLHWKVEGYFFNFYLSEKWEFWKFNKGFFLCFDHFLVCWRFTGLF